MSPQGGTIGSWICFIYRVRQSMVAILGASQNAQWLAAHTWHLLRPSFSIPQLVLPGILKTISKMMSPAVQIDVPRSPGYQWRLACGAHPALTQT